MDSTKSVVEIIVQQGQNMLTSMKELKRNAKKKNKARSDIYQKFCANDHSFAVYTYMDAAIGQSTEVKTFQQKSDLFSEVFTGITTNFDTEVDLKQVEATYEEVFSAYNTMVSALGHADQAVDIKRF